MSYLYIFAVVCGSNVSFSRCVVTSLSTYKTDIICLNLSCIGRHRRFVTYVVKRLRWTRGSVLAFGTQVRGFKPGRSRLIFQGQKILSTPSFGREAKPFVPCRRFTTCKRSLNVKWKSGILRQNSSTISRPSSSSFHY